MTSLIVIGGEAPEKLVFTSLWEKIIAADSGYDTALSLGLVPDVVVGDMDSTGRRGELEEKGIPFASVKKDDTDFVLALREKEGDYDLIGGGEGRLDHTVGIFSAFLSYGAPRLWLTRRDALWSGIHFEFECAKDTLLSFFPTDLTSEATVTTTGLEWNMVDKRVDLSFFSLSNRTVARKCTIDATSPVFIRFPLSALDTMYRMEATC